ncbi:DUF2273 domain-containing protein [Frigoribacterium sp. RIT-PI-h]|uniref:DUF2273 domain-containing protein n=1 Tax=Frigoribacterium sp. RIT-PI-h TaxID=1690245 RepID=UPI0006B98702|nr:DUF2273 domain-containing protein [Frigoribacterium sp. RIT-PI-h]KPG88058.1 hypothetical protein AEQ27_01515 [Frigoribacterium sp. RIT-PI-h]
MTATTTGMAVGAVLAVSALAFGFWGFVLVAVFIAVGALVGLVISGETDVKGLLDALRGRRSSS